MRFNELPKWAQKQVKQWVKEQYLQTDEEARQFGENVPHYTDEELELVATEYINDRNIAWLI